MVYETEREYDGTELININRMLLIFILTVLATKEHFTMNRGEDD